MNQKHVVWNTLQEIVNGAENLCNPRANAACAVFEGKILVSGGYISWNDLKLVEAYDHHENKWTCLPDMINERSHHGSVSMGNKMLVIGGKSNTTCEVFESFSRKFTVIKEIKGVDMNQLNYLKLVGIGNKIFVFPILFRCHRFEKFHIYDVLKDEWCVKQFHLFGFKHVDSCSKLPVV